MTPTRRPAGAGRLRHHPPSDCEIQILGAFARVVGPLDLLRQLQRLFPATVRAAHASDRQASNHTTFTVQLDTPTPGWHQVLRDGVRLWAGQAEDELLPYLEWGINTAAAEWLGRRYLLFHAGSVAYAGGGLILPAPSGSGKSTLVAGLVAAGFQYLSDEVAVLDPAALRLLPFAKSLCIKAGARDALRPLYPELATAIPRRRFGGESVWYLTPSPDSSPSAPLPVRHVVLPRYCPGVVTALRPIARSAALQRLLEQSFNIRGHGALGVGRLVEMLRQARCYGLSVGSLDQAVDALLRLVALDQPEGPCR